MNANGVSGRSESTYGFVFDTLGMVAPPRDDSELNLAIDRLVEDRHGTSAFLEVPEDKHALGAVLDAASSTPDRYKKVLVLGIGGSGLGTVAALKALSPSRSPSDVREVRVLSNVDPQSVSDAMEWFDPADTLLNVVTKSGGTVETLSQLALFAELIRDHGGKDALRDGLVVTTDPERGAVRAMASEIRCRELPVPPGVGGRFSVLTAVGLFPLALAGLDVRSMLDGAGQVVKGVQGPASEAHPSARSAALHADLMVKGLPIRVLWAYCDRLSSFGDWFCQLWAESLGKRTNGRAVGQTPVRAIGSTDQHSLLQLFMEGPEDHCLTFLSIGGPWPKVPVPDMGVLSPSLSEFGGKDINEVFDALRQGTMAALVSRKRPIATIHVPHLDERSIGALFAHFEIETALAGYLLGIDPFDQPGVETGKRFAHGIMGKQGMDEYRVQAQSLLSQEEEF